MNGRWFLRVALVLVLVAGASLLGIGAYQAGLAAGMAADGTVSPQVGPGYGWYPGGFGFGFFGFLGMLLFFFLVFGLVRAAFGGGRGWGGPGRWGPDGGGRRSGWEGRAHDAFESWHREAHDQQPSTPADGSGGGSTIARG